MTNPNRYNYALFQYKSIQNTLTFLKADNSESALMKYIVDDCDQQQSYVIYAYHSVGELKYSAIRTLNYIHIRTVKGKLCTDQNAYRNFMTFARCFEDNMYDSWFFTSEV